MGAGRYTWGGDRRSSSFHTERQIAKQPSRVEVKETRNSKADNTDSHLFPDNASGSHTYAGDGRDAVNFFNNNSNYDELISQMSSSERGYFRKMWATGRFMGGQQYDGFENMTPSRQEATRVFDKYLDKSEINAPFTVYRKAGFELINNGNSGRMNMNQIKSMIGKDIFSAGSMSCGAAKEGLTIGTGKPVEYKINFPKGKGMGMWIGDKRINDWGTQQREFMTNRDSVYTVKGVTYDSNKKMYIVELDYKLGLSHHYGGRVTSKSLGFN